MRAARLTSGAEVMAVQVLLAAVDGSWWPADDGDCRDDDDDAAGGGGGECVMTSADDAGNKRLCGRTDSGLLGVFPSKTTIQQSIAIDKDRLVSDTSSSSSSSSSH